MYYGGWGHCNIVKLSPDLLGVVPFDDGTVYKEVTPQDYVEGPFMLKRNGKYYFMWSEGGWGSPDYRVAYAIADSPFGPFRREGIILQQDADVATGAGHHSVVRGKGKDECTSFTTVVRWEKRLQTVVPPALTGCTLTKKER